MSAYYKEFEFHENASLEKRIERQLSAQPAYIPNDILG